MWDKLVDASVPKILTERVLLVLLFLALSVDDYLLATHHRNIEWLSKATTINTKDAMYFIVVLALSWLFVLPLIKTVVTLISIPLTRSRLTDRSHWLTNSQLLTLAIEENNSVAYQHWENHIKHLKTRQVINELYFYVLIVSLINILYENSFTRTLWSQHPFIALLLLLLVLFLGLAVGIVDNIYANDGITDVPVKEPKKETAAIPRL